jgi:hypothetical protein
MGANAATSLNKRKGGFLARTADTGTWPFRGLGEQVFRAAGPLRGGLTVLTSWDKPEFPTSCFA